ncbi:RNA polymerase sigma factor [Halopseudomonas nanhaiensis]|uniref:RNA polymerase sigma factor n=1 Tax=Halopseudomonas nanhaiensis TaxID=2830842 RepID=UPI003C2AF6A4|nr:RNA polymerase sigma factor [Halopseudomonas nanhaiensis]
MPIDTLLAALYRRQSRKILATLIRLLGDFELAEESMQEAFTAALKQWPDEGVPEKQTAWIIRIARNKGIDQIRRRQSARHYAEGQLAVEAEAEGEPGPWFDEDSIRDDQLRLIFTCCHPSLAPETQLVLTLREMCGLTTEQVARGLLQQSATVAQRIVRAKRKIRDAQIPYAVPESSELPQRLGSVLRVIYLMFNEGYSASAGDAVVNAGLAQEAIRLGRLMAELLPDAEVYGLLALMLLQDSRSAARQTPDGQVITLEDQDRSRWNQAAIVEGLHWLDLAMSNQPVGAYSIQAAIAAAHATAADAASTDWQRIVELYDLLYRMSPTPVIALNRAVAIAMRDGPAAGLALLDELAASRYLVNYHLFHVARADLLRRMGNTADAVSAYEQALALTAQWPERRFIEQRIAALK